MTCKIKNLTINKYLLSLCLILISCTNNSFQNNNQKLNVSEVLVKYEKNDLFINGQFKERFLSGISAVNYILSTESKVSVFITTNDGSLYERDLEGDSSRLTNLQRYFTGLKGIPRHILPLQNGYVLVADDTGEVAAIERYGASFQKNPWELSVFRDSNFIKKSYRSI